MGSTREVLPPQAPLASASRPNDTSHSPRSQEPNTRSYPASGIQTVRSEDSWIELGSQPSSSSLSSIGANDEIITTGLRMQRQHHPQHSRRRRGQICVPQDIDIVYPHRRTQHHTSSSQDEYDESESEEDRVLTSSNEDLRGARDMPYLARGSFASEVNVSSEDEDDDDDNLTALGVRPNNAGFVPQPNAFSHPPASQTDARARETQEWSYSSRAYDSRTSSGTQRNSRSNVRASARRQRQHQSQQHSPYNMISPSHTADHDAALRASLSTLLSCAAAARGLPKSDTQTGSPGTDRNGSGRPADPSGFRLVPESVAMGDDEPGPPLSRPSTHHASESQSPRIPPPRSSPLRTSSKTRRKASPSKDRIGQPSAKRSRRTTTTSASDPNASSSSLVSPTLMTWVISAGVVVLFSAISFSAGYVLGREVGRIEGGQLYGPGGSLGGERTGTNCGREAVRGGLKRLKWIGGGSGSGISA